MEITEEELKAKIAAAVDEATEGLIKKNKQLIGEIRRKQRDQEIDPADFEALGAELDKTRAELDTANKTLKVNKKQLEETQEKLKSEASYNANLLIENSVSGAMNDAKVAGHFTGVVKSMFKSKAIVESDGDNRVVKIDGKPLNEFVSDWAKSEEGQHFVLAPANTGGGANGGANGGSAKTMTREQFDASSQNDRSSFIKDGGKVIDN